MSKSRTPVVIEMTAKTTAVNNLPFRLVNKLSFIANDSPDKSVQINFDAEIGQIGTFTLYAGEVLSDIEMACYSISFQGIGGDVPIRVLGV